MFSLALMLEEIATIFKVILVAIVGENIFIQMGIKLKHQVIILIIQKLNGSFKHKDLELDFIMIKKVNV